MGKETADKRSDELPYVHPIENHRGRTFPLCCEKHSSPLSIGGH